MASQRARESGSERGLSEASLHRMAPPRPMRKQTSRPSVFMARKYQDLLVERFLQHAGKAFEVQLRVRTGETNSCIEDLKSHRVHHGRKAGVAEEVDHFQEI